MTLVLNWASTGPMNMLPPAPHLDLVILVLSWHHRDMVTQFPTGTDLILVTLATTMVSLYQVILAPPGPHL